MLIQQQIVDYFDFDQLVVLWFVDKVQFDYCVVLIDEICVVYIWYLCEVVVGCFSGIGIDFVVEWVKIEIVDCEIKLLMLVEKKGQFVNVVQFE